MIMAKCDARMYHLVTNRCPGQLNSADRGFDAHAFQSIIDRDDVDVTFVAGPRSLLHKRPIIQSSALVFSTKARMTLSTTNHVLFSQTRSPSHQSVMELCIQRHFIIHC